MAGILDVKYKHWHTLGIQFVLLLILTLIIYPILMDNDKLKGKPEQLSFCLLGTYILLNAITTSGHEYLHRKKD